MTCLPAKWGMPRHRPSLCSATSPFLPQSTPRRTAWTDASIWRRQRRSCVATGTGSKRIASISAVWSTFSAPPDAERRRSSTRRARLSTVAIPRFRSQRVPGPIRSRRMPWTSSRANSRQKLPLASLEYRRSATASDILLASGMRQRKSSTVAPISGSSHSRQVPCFQRLPSIWSIHSLPAGKRSKHWPPNGLPILPLRPHIRARYCAHDLCGCSEHRCAARPPSRSIHGRDHECRSEHSRHPVLRHLQAARSLAAEAGFARSRIAGAGGSRQPAGIGRGGARRSAVPWQGRSAHGVRYHRLRESDVVFVRQGSQLSTDATWS